MIIPHCLKKYLRFTSLCSLILLPCLTNAETIYSIGVVPQFEARRIAEIWQPILAEISQLSGVKLELKASPNIPAFEQQFTAGEFDFAYMNP